MISQSCEPRPVLVTSEALPTSNKVSLSWTLSNQTQGKLSQKEQDSVFLSALGSSSYQYGVR